MDNSKDDDLPTGPIELPPDPEPSSEASSDAQAEQVQTEEVVPAAPPVVVAPVQDAVGPPADTSQLEILRHKLETLKENGVVWFKEHKFLGAIIIFITLGFLLYFWPIITCILIAQHMLKNTKGTVNKTQMYKVVGILVLISLSVQAIWIVQLVQATTFSP